MDLCPFLPVEGFLRDLHQKARSEKIDLPWQPWQVPSLKADWEKERKANEFSLSDVPARLLPDSWVEKFEATERPNQAFLRRVSAWLRWSRQGGRRTGAMVR